SDSTCDHHLRSTKVGASRRRRRNNLARLYRIVRPTSHLEKSEGCKFTLWPQTHQPPRDPLEACRRSAAQLAAASHAAPYAGSAGERPALRAGLNVQLCWRAEAPRPVSGKSVGQTQMPDRSVTPETRRALFRALVVAIASGEPEVTPRRIAAAVLRTAEVRSACDGASISTNTLATLVDGELENAFPRVLAAVEKLLVEQGETFGSATHIRSISPRPISRATQQALLRMTETKEALTPVDVLAAVLESDARIADELAREGLTTGILRE